MMDTTQNQDWCNFAGNECLGSAIKFYNCKHLIINKFNVSLCLGLMIKTADSYIFKQEMKVRQFIK